MTDRQQILDFTEDQIEEKQETKNSEQSSDTLTNVILPLANDSISTQLEMLTISSTPKQNHKEENENKETQTGLCSKQEVLWKEEWEMSFQALDNLISHKQDWHDEDLLGWRYSIYFHPFH